MDSSSQVPFTIYGDNIKWFDRQRPALEHCLVVDGEDKGVFVMQKFNGRRRFVVCYYERLCEKYLKIDVEAFHFY